MNKTIIVPTKLNDISLHQFLEFEALPEHLNDNDRAIQTISIFCQLTTAEVRKLPNMVLDEALEKIRTALSDESKISLTFEFNGVEYGFIPNLDNLTTAEFIDIENYQKDRNDLYKVMSVLYRPVTITEDKRYDIESYSGKVNEAFRELPMGYVKGAMLFFCNLGNDLIHYIQKSLEARKTKDLTMLELQHLVGSGDGSASFMALLKETSMKLTKSFNYLSKKHYCGNLTN